MSQSVTGAIGFVLPNGVGEMIKNNGIRHRTGEVSGNFVMIEEGAGRIEGNVVCFTIVGNTVRWGGLIKQSTNAFAPVGSYLVWTQVDNEEQHHAPPDLTSQVFPVDQNGALVHCAVGFNLLGMFPATRGNIEIHD